MEEMEVMMGPWEEKNESVLGYEVIVSGGLNKELLRSQQRRGSA